MHLPPQDRQPNSSTLGGSGGSSALPTPSKPATTTTVNHFCKHDKPKLVFKTKFGGVYAGSARDKCPPPKAAIIFDLADSYVRNIQAFGMRLPRRFDRGAKIIKLHWPDMGEPSLSAKDWQALIWACIRFKRPFFVACQAGHGRTGTALAIIGHFLGVLPNKTSDPVATIRKLYCSDAVESNAQIDYIEKITGRKVQTRPSMSGWQVFEGGRDFPLQPRSVQHKCQPHECRWRPKHNGCDTVGHEPGEPLNKEAAKKEELHTLAPGEELSACVSCQALVPATQFYPYTGHKDTCTLVEQWLEEETERIEGAEDWELCLTYEEFLEETGLVHGVAARQAYKEYLLKEITPKGGESDGYAGAKLV